MEKVLTTSTGSSLATWCDTFMNKFTSKAELTEITIFVLPIKIIVQYTRNTTFTLPVVTE